MATTPDMGKRLTMIILLLIYITVLYTLEGIYITGMDEMQQIDTSVIIQDAPIIDYPENGTYQSTVNTNPISLVLGFFGFLVFAPLGLPTWASAILSFTVLICGVAMGLLVYVFSRDWIPLLS